MNPQTPSQPAPPQPAAVPTQPSPVTNSQFSTAVLQPKTIGFILLVAVLYAATGLIPGLSIVAWLVVAIFTYKKVSELKKSPTDQALESDRKKVTILMAANPVLAQALFYYRLRKSHPNMAKTYNSFGWKVFGLEFIIEIILVVLIFVVTGASINSTDKTSSSDSLALTSAMKGWYATNGAEFKSNIGHLADDHDQLTANSTLSACQQLKTDAQSAQSTPAMPDTLANGHFQAGLADDIKAAQACIDDYGKQSAANETAISQYSKQEGDEFAKLTDRLSADGILSN